MDYYTTHVLGNDEYSLEEILRVVSFYQGMQESMILKNTRKREVVVNRQICMYFACKHSDKSLTAIGKFYGGKDHATVLHAKKTINNLMETNRKFNDRVVAIGGKLFEIHNKLSVQPNYYYLPKTIHFLSIHLGNRRTI